MSGAFGMFNIFTALMSLFIYFVVPVIVLVFLILFYKRYAERNRIAKEMAEAFRGIEEQLRKQNEGRS